MPETALLTVRKREYRITQKERYRRSVFIAEYTQRKYNNIYEEANRFYQKLVKQYPTKTKLTTSPEFKAWEGTLQKDHDPATQMAPSISFTTTTTSIDLSPQTSSSFTTTTTPIDLSPQTSSSFTTTTTPIQLNIPLMDSNEVQEIQDTLPFQEIYPSLREEITPEIIDEIVNEIHESDVDIFNCDEDLNDILNSEINISINELTPLEKELLRY